MGHEGGVKQGKKEVRDTSIAPKLDANDFEGNKCVWVPPWSAVGTVSRPSTAVNEA